MRTSCPLARLICCLLSYTLVAMLISPPMWRAAAFSGAPVGAGKTTGGNAPKRAGADSPRKEGELLVRFSPEVSEQGRDGIASSRGARRKGRQRGESGIEKLTLQPGQDAAAVAEQLSSQPGVELAEPNFVVTRAQMLPDDPRFAEQWALRNTGQSGGVPGSDVGAARAWQATTGSSSTVVAVLDSGVDFTHPDLAGNSWENRREKDNDKDDDRNGYTNDLYGWDFVTDSGVIRDEHGHGTAVAGIIAAQGNNRAGTSGVMWQASLMSLRVLDANGNGDVASAAEAIDYAVSMGAQVINCSWGTDAESLVLRDAIERAGQRGVVVVASAGNGARDLDTVPYFPASFDLPNLISVASSDKFDNVAQFSNWGATKVTVAAPGTDILTTQMGGGYWMVSGTSASAPLVSGIVGLIKTQRPWATAAAAKQAVIDGARRADTLAGKVASGGVANAAGALASLRGPYDPPHGGGNGNGNGKGGNGNGNGNNGGTPRVPDPGRGKGDYKGTPSPPTSTAPPGGPDLNALRDQSPSVPQSPPPAIHADLGPVCQNCYNDTGTDPQFATERGKPANETGQPDVDLGSRNFNWGVPLVSLPGRAGLDLSLGLYYNSLVWTKQQTSTGNWKIQFNADNGFPGPGFHLGFPTLQKRFVDEVEGADAYMLVTPTGGRLKMNYSGSSPQGRVFTSRDGSYTEMIEYPVSVGGGALVRTKDGTQYTFFAIPSGEKRCSQIKDRNGNYITIAYDGSYRPLSATDTLGRVVNFVYDAEGNLYQLTQSRAGSGHTDLLVQFGYGTQLMQPLFPAGLTRLGPNNQYVAVLTRVQFPDGSYYQFYYTQWGQVWKIERRAPNTNLLTAESYNVPGSAYTSASAQPDCPRFTERHDWVRYGVMQQDGESVTTYSEDSLAVCNQSPAADGSVPCKQSVTPDGTVYKEFYATSGWRKGLVTATEVWSGGSRKKWTSNTWVHDGYDFEEMARNPRVVETNVYDDSGNRRRTTIDYGTYAQYSLPYVIAEYAADGTTVLRRTIIDYNLDTAYVSRRIIGLPFQRLVYDGNWALVSKSQYWYDWSGSDMFQDTPAAAAQHDRTNYGPSFVVGRGNLSNAVRFDVNDPNNSNGTAQETKSRYDAAGSTLMVRDQLWHATYFSYGDSFSDTSKNSLNTFAYPTAVTDAEGYQYTSKYDYTTGATTEAKRPSSGTTAQGNVAYETHTLTYDWLARLQKDTNNNNGFYTRWEFPSPDDGLSVKVFQNVRPDLTENYSVQIFDGAGRVRRAASYMPGSTSVYSGSQVFYDAAGNLVQWSNPTEMDANWNPTGADSTTATPAGFGWVYSSRTYDWKGRPLLTTNPDATTTQLSYGGCGCAGGEVVTTRDERGRQKKLYKDVLGRMTKVEELNYDSTVYSTGVYAYNARDQITSVRHYQGAATSGIYQERTFGYDGHGRLQSRTTPEQGTSTYTYNSDDTLAVLTDARGTTQTFGYTARHLLSSITFGAPTGVASTPNVAFTYDAAGNRKQMTDGVGSTTYTYDSLSRMTQESRTFSGVGTYSLTYTYNNAGLASVTGPSQFGSSQVSYAVDHTGAATSVTGSGPTSAPVYEQAMQYRASGAVKSASYGNGRALAVTYDKRLRLDSWLVPGVTGWKYSYSDFGENTGRVTYAQNLYDSVANAADPTLDRSYDYDSVGRLLNSYTGKEAKAHAGRAGGAWGVYDGPYSQSYLKDEWGNIVHKWGRAGDPDQFIATYTNNRRNGFSYDAAGNLTFDGGQTFTYDATGQQATAAYGGYSLQNSYDGDRLRVKKAENGAVTYYLRSSVLGGQVVAEVNSAGALARGYVYGEGGGLLAIQSGGAVTWVYQDAATKSQRLVNASGTVTAAVDLDPWGLETARSWNSSQQPRKYTTYTRDGNQSDEAMMRRYNRWHLRFDQPDPYDGSYDLTDPQSLNRYSYVKDDPINLVDPTGLQDQGPCIDTPDGGIDCGDIISTFSRGLPWSEWDAQYWMRFAINSNYSGYRGTGQRPKGPTRENERKMVYNACLQRKKAEADQAKKEYNAKFSSRVARQMKIGAARGAILGAIAGGTAGAAAGGVGAVPGGLGGAAVGSIGGAYMGSISGVLMEPLFRAKNDSWDYKPALDRARIECDIEADRAIY